MSESEPPALPPAGWFPDPQNHQAQRWWDGERWTEHVHRPEATAPPSAQIVDTQASPAATAVLPSTAEALGDRAGESGLSPPSQSGSTITFQLGHLLIAGAVLIAVAVAVIALVLLTSGGGEEETPAEARATRAREDTLAMVEAHGAQVAVETYATERDGSYAGATPDNLRALEPHLPASLEVMLAAPTSYSVSVAAKNGDRFAIERARGGAVFLTCDHPGEGRCPASGEWAE